MLQLRPVCENCGAALPPHATNARICSFECTFCSECVELLGNVCPNCGGGFCERPIRPQTEWKEGNFLGAAPAETRSFVRPVDLAAHKNFALPISSLPPSLR